MLARSFQSTGWGQTELRPTVCQWIHADLILRPVLRPSCTHRCSGVTWRDCYASVIGRRCARWRRGVKLLLKAHWAINFNQTATFSAPRTDVASHRRAQTLGWNAIPACGARGGGLRGPPDETQPVEWRPGCLSGLISATDFRLWADSTSPSGRPLRHQAQISASATTGLRAACSPAAGRHLDGRSAHTRAQIRAAGLPDGTPCREHTAQPARPQAGCRAAGELDRQPLDSSVAAGRRVTGESFQHSMHWGCATGRLPRTVRWVAPTAPTCGARVADFLCGPLSTYHSRGLGLDRNLKRLPRPCTRATC